MDTIKEDKMTTAAKPAHTPGPWHLAAKQYCSIGIAHQEDGAFRKVAEQASAITGCSQMDGGEG